MAEESKVNAGLRSRPFAARLKRRGAFFLKQLANYRTLLFMLLPAVALVFTFNYIPMFGAVLAFKKYNMTLGVLKSPWIQPIFKNFQVFFKTGKALTVTRNTALYNIAFIVTSTSLEVFFAVVLNEMRSKRGKKALQSAIFLPYFISWVIVGSIAYSLFSYENGTLNGLITSLGGDRIDFYQKKSYWPFIIVFFNAWKGVGYGTVVYLAAIVGIDTSIVEAAEIDGANIFQRIRYVTIPSLTSTIITLTLLALGRVFRGNLDLFYQLVGNSGTLFNTTDVIDTYVFRLMFNSKDNGRITAIGLYQSVLCFFTIIVANYIVKKSNPDYSLF